MANSSASMGVLEEIGATIFKEAVMKIVAILARISDFGEIDRRIIAYYVLATHVLRRLDTFPTLVFRGVISGGKSSTIPLFEALAFRPHKISLFGTTQPALRDQFALSHEGTAIVEEADKEREGAGFEIFLQNRYARNSAITSKMVEGPRGWIPRTILYFGATIVYRRTPFANTAVNSRSITITVKKNRKRKYERFKHCAKEVYSVHKDLEGINDLAFELPEFPVPDDAAGRIIDTYQPLLAIAMLSGDQEFLDSIIGKLKQDTLELDEDQGSELGGIVFRAYLAKFFDALDRDPRQFPSLWTHDVHEEVRENHKIYNLTPEQISKLLRQSGFTVKKSHGRSRVMAPGADTLFGACEEWGCEYDDAVVDLRKRLGLDKGQEEGEQEPEVEGEVEPNSKNTQSATYVAIQSRSPTLSTASTHIEAAVGRPGRAGRSPLVSADSSMCLGDYDYGPSISSIDNPNLRSQSQLCKEQLFRIWADQADSEAQAEEPTQGKGHCCPYRSRAGAGSASNRQIRNGRGHQDAPEKRRRVAGDAATAFRVLNGYRNT